jgi:RND family efflux transporter MFP subunit
MSVSNFSPETNNGPAVKEPHTSRTEIANVPKVRPAIIVGVAVMLAAMIGLYLRSTVETNHESLSQSAKPVSVEPAQKGSFRPSREYVGTLQPWGLAKVGPQYVSAYVGTVLVRPGAVVKRGEVLATLDCRNASAATREIAAKAKAIEERRNAVAHETERMKEMQKGGFASDNELEQLSARTASESAEMESLRASLSARSLEVDDCVLRAPFAGEVADRYVDPGAYVRPGQPVVTVIDRNTVRVTAEAPEIDFAVVAPGTEVKIQGSLTAKISRRAPAADEVTRTIHFEIDVANQQHQLPVGTTATVAIDVGEPVAATLLPLRAATIRGDKATVYAVENNRAKRHVVPVLGELGGTLFVDPSLPAGASIVVEGRALLDDGDQVRAKELEK